MVAIKNRKSFYYKKETVFGEAYDDSQTFKELLASEYSLDARTDKLEVPQMSYLRELGSKSSTGRKTGTLKITKALTKAMMTNHLDLVKSGLGDTTTASSPVSVTGVTTSTLTASSTSYVAGDLIQVTYDGKLSPILLVLSADASSVTLRSELTDAEVTCIDNAVTKTVRKVAKCSIGSPNTGDTYTVVQRYDNGVVEVMRGCGVACVINISADGHAKIEITFEASDVSNSYCSVPYVAPSGTITAEGDYPAIKFDFQKSLLWDVPNVEDIELFPQMLDLKIAHTLEASPSSGQLNNRGGYYTKPNVTCEAKFHHSADNLAIFAEENEANSSQFYFTSQETFAFYAQTCDFVGNMPSDNGAYDSISVKMNINHIATKPPYIVLPQ